MPNSIVQGLTTTTPTDLNKLTAFQMVTLLGLLTRVVPAHPSKEVRTTVSEILHIIEVSHNVAHAVDREWEKASGEKRTKRYACWRYSPKHLQQVHKALLVLHRQSVVIQRRDPKTNHRIEDRIVHILDAFGYTYERDGQRLDLDDLPPGVKKVNVGTKERPVYKVLKGSSTGSCYDRPTGILFRLNSDLANELRNGQGTIRFTLVAGKVFNLFKEHMRNPAAIRLIILILRQTGETFNRQVGQTINDLGWDPTHPQRAVDQLAAVLMRLKASKLIHRFTIDPQTNILSIVVNRGWYQHENENGKA
jgi:hypothetical protein